MLNYSSFNYSAMSIEDTTSQDNLSISGAYWILQQFLVHYQILHLSNGFFSFASYKFIALPTIATAIVDALTRS